MPENKTPDVFTIDINSMTIADIETIEEITGQPIDKIGDPNAPKGKMMRALAFVKARKDNPDVTMEDVGNMVINVADTDPT